MPDEPTVGELWRRLDRIDARLDGRIVWLNTYQAERSHDRDEVAILRREMTQLHTDLGVEIAELRTDVRGISDRISTTFRLAATGVLAPIIVGIVLWLISARGGA